MNSMAPKETGRRDDAGGGGDLHTHKLQTTIIVLCLTRNICLLRHGAASAHTFKFFTLWTLDPKSVCRQRSDGDTSACETKPRPLLVTGSIAEARIFPQLCVGVVCVHHACVITLSKFYTEWLYTHEQPPLAKLRNFIHTALLAKAWYQTCSSQSRSCVIQFSRRGIFINFTVVVASVTAHF